jgi:hypothetical protein
MALRHGRADPAHDVDLRPRAPLPGLSTPVVGHRRGAHDYGWYQRLTIPLEASEALYGLASPRSVGDEDAMPIRSNELHVLFLERA